MSWVKVTKRGLAGGLPGHDVRIPALAFSEHVGLIQLPLGHLTLVTVRLAESVEKKSDDFLRDEQSEGHRAARVRLGYQWKRANKAPRRCVG